MTAALGETTDRLLKLAEDATPGPWEWWTSNSVKRLSHERDGDILYAYRPHRGDPPADVYISQEDMALIAAVPDMIQHIRALSERLARVEAEERERCAKVCDERAISLYEKWRTDYSPYTEGAADSADACAAAIRAGHNSTALLTRDAGPTPFAGRTTRREE